MSSLFLSILEGVISCDLYDKQIFILICRVSLGELDNIQVRFASMSGIKSSKHSGKRMNVDETGVNAIHGQSHLFRASVHGNFLVVEQSVKNLTIPSIRNKANPNIVTYCKKNIREDTKHKQ